MAVVLAAAASPAYQGLAADAKPALGAGDAGARFLEVDTGVRFLWSGSAWSQLARPNGGDLWP